MAKFSEELDKEVQEAKSIYQGASKGLISGGSKAIKELERVQKLKISRAIKDELDGYLLDYMSFLRDCLTTDGPHINEDLSDQIRYFQSKTREEDISELLSAVFNCRARLSTNASQVLVLENLFLSFSQRTVGK